MEQYTRFAHFLEYVTNSLTIKLAIISSQYQCLVIARNQLTVLCHEQMVEILSTYERVRLTLRWLIT